MLTSTSHWCLWQFVATVTQNIGALTGSPVLVWITQLRAGSVSLTTRVVFMDASAAAAGAYQAALVSASTGSIFGSSFGTVAVDPTSVTITTVSNPSEPPPVHT